MHLYLIQPQFYMLHIKDILSLAIPLNKILSRHFFKIIFEYSYLIPVYLILYALVVKNLNFSILLIIPSLFLFLQIVFY